MGLFAVKLEEQDRLHHERVDIFIPIESMANGLVIAGQEISWNLTSNVVDVNAMGRKLKAVILMQKGKPDLYITQNNVGAVMYFDLYCKGVVAFNNKFMRNVGLIKGGLVGNIAANHYQKKIDRKEAAVYDYIEVIIDTVLPRAIDIALNEPASVHPEPETPRIEPKPEPVVDVTERQERMRQEREERERLDREAAERQEKERREREERERLKREAAERQEKERREREAAEREKIERLRREVAERQDRERKEREEKARREQQKKERDQFALRQQAATSEGNVMSKLVYITSEEAKSGCSKQVKLLDGRTVQVEVPAGTTYSTKVRMPGCGHLDEKLGVRGELVISFGII